MTRPALSLDTPIPFTLTPKALAALRDPAPTSDGPEPGEWACQQCGAAWFGPPPDDGLCPGCRGDGGGQ
jgi:rubrerythrin